MTDAAPTEPGSEYEFTNDWFGPNIPVWRQIVDGNKPARILEIGSFEGRSTCWLIEACAALADLIAERRPEPFDLVYIDGSHQAPDVLTDAVLAFQLLKVGGVMIFDDYLWSMDRPGTQDVLMMPKPAIDAFLNIFQRKTNIFTGAPLRQLYVRKIAA